MTVPPYPRRDALTGAPLDAELTITLDSSDPRSIPTQLHRNRMVQAPYSDENLGQMEWARQFIKFFGDAYAGGHPQEYMEAAWRWYHWVHDPYLVNRVTKHYPRPDALPAVLALHRDEEPWREIYRRYQHTLPWVEKHYHRMTQLVRSRYLLDDRAVLAGRAS